MKKIIFLSLVLIGVLKAPDFYWHHESGAEGFITMDVEQHDFEHYLSNHFSNIEGWNLYKIVAVTVTFINEEQEYPSETYSISIPLNQTMLRNNHPDDISINLITENKNKCVKSK